MRTKPILEVVENVTGGPASFSGVRSYFATADIDGSNLGNGTAVTCKDRPLRANLVGEPGDVLFAKMQATEKVLQLTVESSKAIYSTGFFNLRPLRSQIHPRYLFWFLRSCYFQTEKDRLCTGATQKALTLGSLEKIRIHLPGTLEEQESIAANLDKADAICQKRKQLLNLAEEFLMSVFLETFGDPVANTKGFPVQALGAACVKVTDGTHDTPPRQSSGIMFITGKNIRPFKIDRENVEFVSEEVHQEIYRRCNPEYGDVLYTNIGAGTGTAAFNEYEFQFSMKNVALLKPNPRTLQGRYLEFVMNNEHFKQRLISQYGQGGAQGFLGLKTIKSVKIPLPPIGLQNRFHEIVSRVRTASVRVKLAHIADKALFLSLSEGAFHGEL